MCGRMRATNTLKRYISRYGCGVTMLILFMWFRTCVIMTELRRRRVPSENPCLDWSNTCLTIGGKPFGCVTDELSVTRRINWYPVTSESVIDAWGAFYQATGKTATVLSGASRVLAIMPHINWKTGELQKLIVSQQVFPMLWVCRCLQLQAQLLKR